MRVNHMVGRHLRCQKRNIAVGSTWLYLATVIDICSRQVVGWSIADHMRTQLVTDAIEMAVVARGGDVVGVVFHARARLKPANRLAQEAAFTTEP